MATLTLMLQVNIYTGLLAELFFLFFQLFFSKTVQWMDYVWTHQLRIRGTVNNKAELLTASLAGRHMTVLWETRSHHSMSKVKVSRLKSCQTMTSHHAGFIFKTTQKEILWSTPMPVPRCKALLQNRVLISVEQDIVKLRSAHCK